MRTVRTWIPFVVLAALAMPLSAQQPETRSWLERLERLEQHNERLERQNQLTVSEGAKNKEAAQDTDEGFVVGKSLKFEGTWKNGLWFETADKAFKWNVGGVVQFDMNWYGADRDSVNSIGAFNNLVDPGLSLQDGMSFRRARLRFSGTMWEQIEFFAQYEFAQALDLRRRTLGISPVPTSPPINDFDPGDDVGFNEVYLGFTDIPLLGTIRIGRTRESLNFVTATADNNQVWLERGLLFDAFNGDFNFSNGVTVQRNFFDGRAYALGGFFQINNNSNRGFYAVGDGEYAYDGRLTFLPVWDEASQLWVHLGVDYSYRNLHYNQVRYRARPMTRSGPVFLAPNILNTGTIFSPDAQQIGNLEFAMAYGRWTLAAEATASWVTNAFTGGLPAANGLLPNGVVSNGTFNSNGAYAEALCFLTPDHRRYKKDRPGYDRVVPKSNFYFVHGERGLILTPGAWEVGLRYDYVDLTDSGINGGVGNAVTACVNWYLNPSARIQANYFWMRRDFEPADAAGRVNGDLQGFALRFNVDF